MSAALRLWALTLCAVPLLAQADEPARLPGLRHGAVTLQYKLDPAVDTVDIGQRVNILRACAQGLARKGVGVHNRLRCHP